MIHHPTIFWQSGRHQVRRLDDLHGPEGGAGGGTVVATGTPVEAITPESLARVYGVAARVEHCSRGGLQIMVDEVL